MLARAGINIYRLFILNHTAVSPHIAVITIQGFADTAVCRTDVAPPIMFMPFGHRKLQNINIVALDDILHHRAGINIPWWNRFIVLKFGGPFLDNLRRGKIFIQTKSDPLANLVLHHIRHYTESRIIRNITKQRNFPAPHGNHFRDRSDFKVPVSAADPFQVVRLLIGSD